MASARLLVAFTAAALLCAPACTKSKPKGSKNGSAPAPVLQGTEAAPKTFGDSGGNSTQTAGQQGGSTSGVQTGQVDGTQGTNGQGGSNTTGSGTGTSSQGQNSSQQVNQNVNTPTQAQVTLDQTVISPTTQQNPSAPIGFRVRFPRHIVGKPQSVVNLPTQGDTFDQLPLLDKPLLSATQSELLPANTRVWGQLRLKKEASQDPTSRTVFIAQGFVLPNTQRTVYTLPNGGAGGIIPSKDEKVVDIKDTLLHSAIGAGAGAAVSVIISLTTGDQQIQAWETLAGATVGGLLAGLLWKDQDPVVVIEKETAAYVCFGIVCQ